MVQKKIFAITSTNGEDYVIIAAAFRLFCLQATSQRNVWTDFDDICQDNLPYSL